MPQLVANIEALGFKDGTMAFNIAATAMKSQIDRLLRHNTAEQITAFFGAVLDSMILGDDIEPSASACERAEWAIATANIDAMAIAYEEVNDEVDADETQDAVTDAIRLITLASAQAAMAHRN